MSMGNWPSRTIWGWVCLFLVDTWEISQGGGGGGGYVSFLQSSEEYLPLNRPFPPTLIHLGNLVMLY